MAKAAAKKKAATKTEIFNSLAERTGLTKKQVAVNNEVVESFGHEIAIGDLIHLSIPGDDEEDQLYSEEVEYLP